VREKITRNKKGDASEFQEQQWFEIWEVMTERKTREMSTVS
jgi:hypothetical protein